MIKIAGAVFLALVAVCAATNSQGVLYPFEINEVLVCHVENPFKDIVGEPEVIPEVPPRIPFDSPILVNDGFIQGIGGINLEYELWLPQISR